LNALIGKFALPVEIQGKPRLPAAIDNSCFCFPAPSNSSLTALIGQLLSSETHMAEKEQDFCAATDSPPTHNSLKHELKPTEHRPLHERASDDTRPPYLSEHMESAETDRDLSDTCASSGWSSQTASSSATPSTSTHRGGGQLKGARDLQMAQFQFVAAQRQQASQYQFQVAQWQKAQWKAAQASRLAQWKRENWKAGQAAQPQAIEDAEWQQAHTLMRMSL